jgi:hypothetical protein
MERKILEENRVILDKSKEILDDLYKRNEEFNEFMDENCPYEYKDSEALFYTQVETYVQELESWRENKSKEEFVDIISFFGQEGTNTLHELSQSIQRKRIAPFVGSGLSAALDFPSWKQALKEIRAKLSDIELQEFDKFIEENDYLNAADILFKEDARAFTSYITDRFMVKPNTTSSDLLIGALQYLPEVASGCVITTNFDKALEKVFKLSNKSFDGFMHGTQNKNKFVTDLIKGERCILKLHGSVGEEESYIFTKTQYTEAYGDTLNFQLPLPKTLRQIFVSHSLLFLGCSLEQDRTLELFQLLKNEGSFEIPQHFAILPDPGNAVLKREKENYLREINIKTLWYPEGEHEYVETILKLAIQLASNKIKL